MNRGPAINRAPVHSQPAMQNVQASQRSAVRIGAPRQGVMGQAIASRRGVAVRPAIGRGVVAPRGTTFSALAVVSGRGSNDVVPAIATVESSTPQGGTDEVTPAVSEEPAAAETEYGMLITDVNSNGAAAKADLRVNDIILSFGGNRIQSFEDLQGALGSANGATEVVFFNSETKQVEKLNITPANARLGIATVAVEIE